MKLGTIDILILGGFFVGTLLVGVWHKGQVTLDDYWVNRRKTNRFVLVATSLSTFIGAGSILSTASFAYTGGGLATLAVPLSFCLYSLIFARYFGPKIKQFGDAHGAYTVPDFLAHTFSKRVALGGSLVILMSWAFYIAVQMLAIGSFVSTLSGIDPTLATVFGGGLVVAYTAVGGLQADIRTDVFQFIVMLFLFVVFLPWVISAAGGVGAVQSLPADFLTGQNKLAPHLAVLAVLMYGAGVLTSADMWQRAYAADTASNVRWAMTVTSGLILVFMTMGSLFGVYGQIILPGIDPNLIVPSLLTELLPQGLYGLVLAGFFAAILSTADSVLLVTSMTLVHDIGAKQLGIKLDIDKTLRVSRWVTLFVGVVGVLVAVTVNSLVNLSIQASSFYVALLPSIVFGFYSKRPSELGALASTVVGAVAILIIMKFDPITAFIPGLILSFIAYGIGAGLQNRAAKTPAQ